jgi:ABC-2 type transport system permease protein
MRDGLECEQRHDDDRECHGGREDDRNDESLEPGVAGLRNGTAGRQRLTGDRHGTLQRTGGSGLILRIRASFRSSWPSDRLVSGESTLDLEATMVDTRQEDVRIIEPETRLVSRWRDLLRYRELMANLVRKELRVKYKNSLLGFMWSLLNPALTLAIFWLVLTKFLAQQIPLFAIFLLSGLLGWNLLSWSLNSSVGSLVNNANLVTKVYFPREVLPLATIGAGLVHFMFQLVVMIVALIVLRAPVSPAALVLVPAALAVELLLLAGVCLIAAVLNVYFRDVQHLIEVGMLAWFWLTPIVYPIAYLQQNLGHLWTFSLLNPMTSIVLALQRGLYVHVSPVDAHHAVHRVLVDAPISWYLRNLGIVGACSLVLFVLGWSIFRRLESRLAEEL